MQHILGLARKAIEDYEMIQQGDRVLVGVSGGKDSLVLLAALARLRGFLGVPFEVVGFTLDMGFGGYGGYEPVAALCRELGVEYICRESDIGHIVFEDRREKNPCSLCARMRRGALHDAAKQLGCGKVALGHHADDAAQTLMMNLFNESRIGCFSPVTYMSRKDITVIRPLVYCWEREVAHAARAEALPVVKSRCPNDRVSERSRTRDFLASLEAQSPGVTKRIYGSLKRSHVGGW